MANDPGKNNSLVVQQLVTEAWKEKFDRHIMIGDKKVYYVHEEERIEIEEVLSGYVEKGLDLDDQILSYLSEKYSIFT